MSSSRGMPPIHEPEPHHGGLAPGALFAGRYRVVRRIATGGMGVVYDVVHVETERRHALKVMHSHLFQSDEMRERFKREARIAAQVESEHIVDVSDAGVDEATKTPFLVMEMLYGEELSQRVRRLGPLPASEVLAYLQQIALALDKTHAKMIVHRDLKPANVFLTERDDGSPRVKILDFGVAKVLREGATGDAATRTLGTPLYMAPEQFRSEARLTPAVDVHALGMMAFALLVGKAYWAAEARASGDVIAFALKVVQGPKESAVSRARAHDVILPEAFDGWFSRVTAPDPADRFPKASEAVLALGEALGFGPTAGVAAPPVPEPPAEKADEASSEQRRTPTTTDASVRSPPIEARRRRRPLAVGIALFSIGVGVAVGWLSLCGTDTGPKSAEQPVIEPAAPPVTATEEPATPVTETAETQEPPPEPTASTETLAPADTPPAPEPVRRRALPRATPVAKPTAAPAATPREKPGTTAFPSTLIGRD